MNDYTGYAEKPIRISHLNLGKCAKCGKRADRNCGDISLCWKCWDKFKREIGE